MNELDRVGVGKQIRSCRMTKKLSQEVLSEKVGISVTHLSNIENGKTTGSVDIFIEIANVLEVSLDVLFRKCLKTKKRNSAEDELAAGLEDCTNLELQYIEEVVRTTKKALREYEKRSRQMYEEGT